MLFVRTKVSSSISGKCLPCSGVHWIACTQRTIEVIHQISPEKYFCAYEKFPWRVCGWVSDGNAAVLIAMGSVLRFCAKLIREDINSVGITPVTCFRTHF